MTCCENVVVFIKECTIVVHVLDDEWVDEWVAPEIMAVMVVFVYGWFL